jgi:hypothetical protein
MPQDLPSDTILVVEVYDSKFHWMQPGDIVLSKLDENVAAYRETGIGDPNRTGFHVGFADGEVWHLTNDVPFHEFRKFCTVSGARRHDRTALLARYRL